MLKNISLLIISYIFIQTMTACEVIDGNSGSKGSASSPTDGGNGSHGESPQEEGAFACYLETCFETLPAGNLQDANRDYVYPNPNNFSDVDMRPQYIAPSYFFDLSNIDANKKIASNFKIGDFMSARKGRYGLFSSDVVTKLQSIRNNLKRAVYVTSGYRSPGYNRNTDGAARWSRHTYGDAVDFYVEGKSIDSLVQVCKNQNSSFELTYTRHIHCDWRENKLDPAFYDSSHHQPFSLLRPMTMAQIYSSQSDFNFEANGNLITVSANTPAQIEDHHDSDEIENDRLTYRWSITLPNNDVIESSDETVTLPRTAGAYKFQVIIGGTIHLEKIYQW
jgi:Peptidase M15